MYDTDRALLTHYFILKTQVIWLSVREWNKNELSISHVLRILHILFYLQNHSKNKKTEIQQGVVKIEVYSKLGLSNTLP